MSGHSKWSNIKHKKEKTDAQRAKIFTKVGREIAAAVKSSGPDPNANSRLKDAIAKAKAGNVPNDNIERIIKKASGSGDTDEYFDVQYEGYGPSGVAILVECLTDNRNRTAGDMRHYFDKFGGNLGSMGSVSWQFSKNGVIVVGSEGLSEEQVLEDALEAGAADVFAEEEVFEIITEPDALPAVREAMEKKGYAFLSAEEEMIPSTHINLTSEDDVKNMQRLLDALEEDDDVQNFWHNWGNAEE